MKTIPPLPTHFPCNFRRRL